jgi:hypothetical protein
MVMNPDDISGISLNKDWGAGMIKKGLNGKYKDPCQRALLISEIIRDNTTLLSIAWGVAKVHGNASPSLAALTLWLARGRAVYDARDGVRAGNKPEITIEELLKIINNVEICLKEGQNISLENGKYKADSYIHRAKNDYLPNKDDFESAYRMLCSPGEKIDKDSILDQIEKNAINSSRNLKTNWRLITERNIKIWVNEAETLDRRVDG